MDEAHLWTDEQLEKLEGRLREVYNTAYKEMNEKYKSLMSSFEADRAKMKERLAKGEIDEKAYRQWLRSRAVRGRWLGEMSSQLAKRAAQADKEAAAMVNGKLPGIYAENYNFGTYSIESGAHIDTAFAIHNEDTIRALMMDDPDLLPQASVDSAKDLRWNRQHFQSAITQGILQGESIPKIAKRLRSVLDMDLRSSIRNARTATTAAENMGRMASFDRAQKMGIKLKKEWMATLDGRTRHSHRQLDGVAIENDATFDNGCKFPGDPHGPSWEVYGCRCGIVVKLEDLDQSTAERFSRLGSMTYEEWKAGKPKQQKKQKKSPKKAQKKGGKNA